MWIMIVIFILGIAFMMWSLVSANPVEDNYEDQMRSIKEYELKHNQKKG